MKKISEKCRPVSKQPHIAFRSVMIPYYPTKLEKSLLFLEILEN